MPNFGTRDVAGVVLLLIVITSESLTRSSYVCPKKFVAIGRKCYYFSKDEAAWHDAHFRCKSLNSSLAVVTKSQQEITIRRYLNRRKDGKHERWLGGRYNDRQSRWVWGENGKPLAFYAFSRMNYNDPKWAWHCIIVDPQRQNKWSARSCVEEKRYICQRSVLGKRKFNRSKCYTSSDRDARELCAKQKVGESAPGYLVKKPVKPRKPNPYHVATFVCPTHMILVGRKCYFFSPEKASWSNAYWSCRDNKTKLAVITTKMQDNILRGFLKGTFTEKHERWIGGIFDWKQQKWKWAMSGRVIRYKHFAKEALVTSKNNTHHCITLDPEFDNLWNSKNRLEEKHYICQAKSKSVVKYNKTLQATELTKPDATVVINAVESDNRNQTNKKIEAPITYKTPAHYNNEVTDKYVYN
ncbi:secretory phospholipase A2 receptor-like isoform X2 [Zophobas morio]|uniref:secretory phospholipase A2 receptor-like isoform X2 n=1 Tax=Zophobas morio TaxID=2755281 RepID=UPI0030837BD8